MRRLRTKAEQKQNTDDLSVADDLFAQEIVKGASAADALRRSRDCSNMLPESIWSYASRIRNDLKVSARIGEYRKALMGKATESLEEHIAGLHRLREIAIESGNIGAAVQAHQSAGKAQGHYTERLDITTSDPLDALKLIEIEFGADVANALAKKSGLDTEH